MTLREYWQVHTPQWSWAISALKLSSLSDSDFGDLRSYTWDFGDGSSDSGATPSHTYASHGIYTLTLTVTDDENNTISETATVTVKAPPVAVAGDDQTVDVDTIVNFDGTGSYDPDGGSLTYSWTFGSGAYDIQNAATATPSCKYDTHGSKTVTLTVTDDESDTHSDTLTVTVEPAPTVALELSGPDSITRGEIGTYTATITPANLSLTWNPTFRWKYTTSILYDGATEIRKNITATSTNRKSTTWSGEMVKSGTLNVHVFSINGVRLEQTMDVTVNDRDWVTEVPVTTDATYWGIDTPRSLADLAEVEYGIPFDPETDVTTAEVNAGPNEGIKYTDDLEFSAPITIRVNRHLSLIDDDDLPCWAAFRSANSAYADIESKVKSSFGFDAPVNRSLHYRWNNLILHGDMKEAIEEYVRGPDIDLDEYRDQVEVYLTGVSASRLTSFERTVSNWSVRGIQIDYDYLCADAGMDQTVYAGETVNFDGSNSSAPDARTINTYAWNFATIATPATGSGAMPSCSFGTAGVYNVTLTITDDQGATAVDTCEITVLPSVLTADAGDDRTVSVGSPVTFDGSMSYVPPGRTITTYEWNFGDGTTGTGVQPTHTYTTAGAYIVTLTVTDDLGNSATDDATTDAPIATAFNGALSLDTNRIVIPSDSAGRASGAGGATAKSTTPPIVDPPPITTPPVVNPPTVDLPPSTVNITCEVLPAGFTPTSVTAEVHNGDAHNATTLVIQFALTETSSGSGSYTGSWDGMDENGAPVADDDFQIVGVVNHEANGVQQTYTTAPAYVAVSDARTIVVRIFPEPTSETSAAIDTEADHGAQSNMSPEGDDSRSDPATIWYEISGGVVHTFTRKVTLETWTSGPANGPAQVETLSNVTGIQQIDYYGRGLAQSLGYRSYRVRIVLYLDTDNNPLEMGDARWEEKYESNFHPVTVQSLPLAQAGGNRAVAFDSEADPVVPVTVSFDASGSSDPDDSPSASADGVITGWKWTFEGTDVTQDAGSDQATTETVDTPYRSVGIKNVTLLVTDNDTPTPHEDDDTITVTVMDMEYTAPAEDAQLVLPTIDVNASPLPAELDAPITWTMTIGSTDHSHDTTTAPDTITLSPFPTENSHFGDNTITATLTHEGVSISEDKSVRLFWNNDGGENGSGNPNWYHFWSQTPASSGNHRWDRLGNLGTCAGANGWYNFGDGLDYFYLCDSVRYNIDTFAKTCLHEIEHMRHYDEWWRDLEGGYRGNREDMDKDGDRIPDDEEEDLNFDNTLADSDRDGDPDHEELAKAAELEWDKPDNANRPAAHSQDWSEGGKQWVW